MRISTRLTLMRVIFVAVIVAMLGVMWSVTETVRQELAKNEVATEILNGVFSIRYLMQEYMLHHEERARVQWSVRDASLSSLFVSPSKSAGAGDETLARLSQTNAAVQSLFSQIVANYQAGDGNDRHDELSRELEERLAGQVMIRIEAMISDATSLSAQSRAGVLAAQSRIGTAVAVFVGVILMIFAVTAVTAVRIVFRPLERLRAGAAIIGSGDLDFRLDDANQDEIGDVARAFNDMAEKLRGRDAKIRRLVDSNIIGIVISDLEGDVIEANDAFLGLIGYGRLDLQAGLVNWKAITPPDLQKANLRVLQELRHHGTVAPFETEYCHKDGRRIPVLVGGVLLEGSPASSLSFVLDLTERKTTQEALARTQADLTHMARVSSLGALTASIAHEVSQPLSGIITNAGTCLRMLAADPPNVDGARETARRTIRDGNRASDVVKRLRALFAKQSATIESVDLNEAAREVIALLRSELQKSRASLRVELADGLPPVMGDRVQLQQVILNLLVNAADAMNDVDDRPRQLVVETGRDEDGRVRLTVQDTGVGFDPEGMERLFDAFYTTKSGGMGIGLSVSRSIIESHHGRLWARPNDGPGATFSFSIPLPAESVPTDPVRYEPSP